MKETLSFGLVGCGRIAPRHAQCLQEIPRAKLIAVADCVESRARHFAREFGVSYSTDYHCLLERNDIDVVSICTPSGMHAQMAIEAMQAGKHVLVEKPMSLALEDADRMLAFARNTGVRLGIVLQNRYNPPMQALKRAVTEGKFGKLLLGNATVRWYRTQEYYEDEWHGTWAMDGGALMNQSIHHIDALQWLMGEPESVSAYTATLAHRMEAEDVGVAIIRFKTGALASVEGSTVTYPENLEASISLFGEHGSAKVGGTALNRKVFWKFEAELEHEREMLTREQLDPPSVYGQSHKLVIADMVDAVFAGRDPETSGVEARKSLALVLAMYESARAGKSLMLDKGAWHGRDL
jgi:UDP-N-acetyl-2-amino-2-deoxyglucuronate dehydrogenase